MASKQDMWLEIKADIEDVKKKLSYIEKEFRKTKTVAEKESPFKGWIADISHLYGTILAFSAVFNATFRGLIDAGLQFNRTMEQTKVGMAAILTSVAEIRDEFGNAVEGAEKFSGALEIAKKLQEQLRIEAVRSTAEYTQLVGILQGILAPALASGLNQNQIVQMTVLMANAVKTLGLDLNQAVQESRDLLMGTIDMNSQLARSLGITNEMVKKWKEQGTLFENITQKLRGFQLAQGELENTFDVLVSNVKETFDILAGQALKPIFDQLKKDLKGVYDSLFTINEEGIRVVKPELLQEIREFGQELLQIYNVVKVVVSGVFKFLWSLRELTFEIAGTVVGGIIGKLIRGFKGGLIGTLFSTVIIVGWKIGTALMEGIDRATRGGFTYVIQRIFLFIDENLTRLSNLINKVSLGTFGISDEEYQKELRRLQMTREAIENEYKNWDKKKKELEKQSKETGFSIAPPEQEKNIKKYLKDFKTVYQEEGKLLKLRARAYRLTTEEITKELEKIQKKTFKLPKFDDRGFEEEKQRIKQKIEELKESLNLKMDENTKQAILQQIRQLNTQLIDIELSALEKRKSQLLNYFREVYSMYQQNKNQIIEIERQKISFLQGIQDKIRASYLGALRGLSQRIGAISPDLANIFTPYRYEVQKQFNWYLNKIREIKAKLEEAKTPQTFEYWKNQFEQLKSKAESFISSVDFTAIAQQGRVFQDLAKQADELRYRIFRKLSTTGTSYADAQRQALQIAQDYYNKMASLRVQKDFMKDLENAGRSVFDVMIQKTKSFENRYAEMIERVKAELRSIEEITPKITLDIDTAMEQLEQLKQSAAAGITVPVRLQNEEVGTFR
ncbi:hypothetical protein [Persephonella sp.]